jgi:hypothetical protein
MISDERFHPNLNGTPCDPSLRTRVHHIKSADLSSKTSQTTGTRRPAAITSGSVGSKKIGMGEMSALPTT